MFISTTVRSVARWVDRAAGCHDRKSPIRSIRLLAALFSLATATATSAAPVAVGDLGTYSRIRLYGDPYHQSYLDPAVELATTGVIRAETDVGEEVGLALAAPFGAYGGEAAFIGGQRRYGGDVIYGTETEVWYEQRYRTTTAHDSLTANLFGMDLLASDGGSAAVGVGYRAGFLLTMYVTLDDPAGPDASTATGLGLGPLDANDANVYARITAFVEGHYGDWKFFPPVCDRFLCTKFQSLPFDVTRSDSDIHMRIPDASIDLGDLGLPADTQFTLTQHLVVLAAGRVGESYVEARLYDPTQGLGVSLTGSDAPALVVPEPAPLGLATAVVSAMFAAGGLRLRRHRRVMRNPS